MSDAPWRKVRGAHEVERWTNGTLKVYTWTGRQWHYRSMLFRALARVRGGGYPTREAAIAAAEKHYNEERELT